MPALVILLASAGFGQAAKFKIQPRVFVLKAVESMMLMRLRGITNDLPEPVAGRVRAWIGESSLTVSITAAEGMDCASPVSVPGPGWPADLRVPFEKAKGRGLGTARSSQPVHKWAFSLTPHTVVDIGFTDLLPVVPERLSRHMNAAQNYRLRTNAKACHERYAGPTLVVARNRESLNVPETRHGSSCPALPEVPDCSNCSILTNGQQTSYRSRVEEPFGRTEKSL
jgi:hypothetical protein